MSEVANAESNIHGEQIGLQMVGAKLPELFVINLCAAMTPMPAIPKSLTGFEKYKLYQVSRQEDGRRRFRLRLGFFTSEADAEWVLNSVRSLYPTAFTGCLTQEDLRYASDVLPPLAVVATPSQPTVPTSTVTPLKASREVTPPIAAAKVAVPNVGSVKPRESVSVAAPAAPVTTRTLPTQAKQDIKLVDTAVASQQATHQKSDQVPAYHVARGIDLPETTLELTDEYPIVSAPSATKLKPTVKPPTPPPAAKPTPAPVSSGPIRSASIVNAPKVVDDYVPILDTTLTIRTLTKAEAEDPNRAKWFVVQLAQSDQPINLDTMPKLDIFAAYNLYCVALMEGGTIRHALRLGFFRENVSAEAVMGYLKAFFPAPAITQISTAEHDRFAESKVKTKPVVEKENVINLNDKRTPPANNAPQRSPAVTATKPATVTASKARDVKLSKAAPPARPQSFLSRLIGRQLD